MNTKAFEIRDAGTFIPVLATLMVPDGNRLEGESYLLRRAGYSMANPCVILCRMDANGHSRQASYDPYGWGANDRTFSVAHDYITKNFHSLSSGDVIDVEFIMKETDKPKVSERFE